MLETILSFFPDVFFWFFGAIGVLGLFAGLLGLFMGNGGEGTKKLLAVTTLTSLHFFTPVIIYYALLHFIESKWACAAITMVGVPAIFHSIGGISKQESQDKSQDNGEKQENPKSGVDDVLKNDVQNTEVQKVDEDKVDNGQKSTENKVSRITPEKAKAYLDRIWDTLISDRRAGKNVDSIVKTLGTVIVNYQKSMVIHEYISADITDFIPEESRFTLLELKASEMASVFLRVMTAKFIPEEDLLKKKGSIVPLSLFKFIVSYGVLYSGDKQIKNIQELSLDGNYRIDIKEMRKALSHCASLIDEMEWNEKVEELNKLDDKEYYSVTESLLKGIVQHLREA